jgi:predicted membrane-bound mannosyltransferase
MAAILHFFTSYAVVIYLLLLVGLLFAGRGLLRARRELSESVFGLERESARRHTRESVAAFVMIISLGVAEVVLTVFLAPNLPASDLLATPTNCPIHRLHSGAGHDYCPQTR